MRASLKPGFWIVLWRKFRWLTRRPFLLLLVSAIPIAVFLVLAGVYFRGVATELPIVVVDLDDTPVSRQVVRLVAATPDVRVLGKVASLSEGRHGLVSGRYYGLLFIPQHFSRDATAGRRPEINYFYNTQMLAAGNMSRRGMSRALPSIVAQVQTVARMNRGMSAEQSAVSIQPIAIQTHGLFNPGLDYSHFILAALAVVVLQLTVSLATCYSVGLDADTPHRLRVLRRLGGGVVPAVCGKLLPLTIVAVLVHAACDVILFGYFGLPIEGAGWLLVVSAVVFVLSCQFVGALLALLVRPPAAALSALGLIVSPSFGYLGVSFPREAMNGFSQFWGNIFPATQYLTLRFDQTLRGVPIEISLQNFGAQLIYLAVAGALLYLRLSQMRRRATATRTQPMLQAPSAIAET